MSPTVQFQTSGDAEIGNDILSVATSLSMVLQLSLILQ